MPVRVLIAEDEWLIALALRSQLERLGYEVVAVARTGAEALQLCPQRRPDVVFMDVQMPEMDGLTATRQLMETCPQAVVIVTGKSTAREAAEEAGAMGFAVKPLLDLEVADLIQEASQRFARFCAVREECGGGEAGMTAWLVVRRALRRLAEQEGLPEARAFAYLQQHAAARVESLRQAAQEILFGFNGRPRGEERGAA